MKSAADALNNIFYGKFKHISRFSVVGAFNTFIDFLVFTILNSLLGVNYMLSQALGYGFGVANSFVFNRKWTFRENKKDKKTYKELIQFIVVNSVSLFVTVVMIRLFVNRLSWNVYVSKVAVTIIAQLINFFAYKFWVFN